MRRLARSLPGACLLAGLLLLGVVVSGAGGAAGLDPASTSASTGAVATAAPTAAAAASPRPPAAGRAGTAAQPLRGFVVVLDPGHQLGNSRHPAQVNRPVPDGAGGTKACNTTGTATNGGYPEATFTWSVVSATAERLRALGAWVRLTRSSNSTAAWGPCVDARGRLANPRAGASGSTSGTADLRLSVHGDGAAASARGFHVIRPGGVRGQSSALLAASDTFARDVRYQLTRRGLATASYVGTAGLDRRRDLATLNFSRVPVAMVELGNMRNAGDARRMTTASGRLVYAQALTAAVQRYLTR